MSKHTPGPWIFDDGESHAFGVFAPEDHDAVCWLSEQVATGKGLRGFETDLANARLIAAAPELLEVLETIENDGKQVPAWLWDKIQAAIAKAKGR